MVRVLVRRLHEVTFTTPDGPLTVAIALLLDGRLAVYEWDEEHGYFPLVDPHELKGGAPQWRAWTTAAYGEFATRVNKHPSQRRELPVPPPSELPVEPPPKAKRSKAIRCPFCKAKHTETSQIQCEHLIAEGDPEACMVYHHPLLHELMKLAERAYEEEIDFAPLGSGIPGWEQPMKGDERDVLTGDFLREVPGFTTKSRTVQAAMSESVYFWIFGSPKCRKRIEGDFSILRDRLRAAIAGA